MKIAAYLGNRAHGPANSRLSLISAYTGGADVLHMAVRRTADGKLVLAHNDDVRASTGFQGRVSEMTLAQLRQLDFAQTFAPRGAQADSFHFFDPAVEGRRLAVDELSELIPHLPSDATWLVEIPEAGEAGLACAEQAAELLRSRGASRRSVIASADAEALSRARAANPLLRLALVAGEDAGAGAADLVIVPAARILEGDAWTELGRDLIARHASGELAMGLYVLADGMPAPGLVERCRREQAVWAIAVDSTFDAPALRPAYTHLDESFAGTAVDRTNFALGYAKANRYGTVRWNDGVHVVIAPYDGPVPRRTGDPLEDRLSRLEWDLINVAKEWPFYSGGGVGTTVGIGHDFAAEVTYTVAAVGQATTLEMAVVNVDPGAHRGSPPQSFRDKDSFYDPHGAPPFVGVEHDEDDGFRINWNLGSEYDNNQYGRPVGDGRAARGARMRLERRGAYFSAYYRDPIDAEGRPLPPQDWVCVGVTRNDTLNNTVFLRCVGKRWRQERESDPSAHEPVIPNHFTFSDLHITCFPGEE